VWTHIDNGSKLDARSEECVFLGYEEGTEGGLQVNSLKGEGSGQGTKRMCSPLNP